MMNSDRLARRIDQALKAIEQQRQALAAQRFALPLHLLASSEQEQLVAFLDQLRNKYACEHISKEVLRLVTHEELDRLGNWLSLLKALEQEDLDAASRYRRALAATHEQLVAAFLSIDERQIPPYDHAPVVTRDGVIYHLYRTHFRSTMPLVERAIEQGRLTSAHFDDMRLWVEMFSPAQAA